MNKTLKEFIDIVKKNDKLISTRLNRKYFESLNKERLFDKFIELTNFTNDESVAHRIKFCEAGYTKELPKCYCGNSIKILSRVISNYCSDYCAKHDPKRAEKISKTKKASDSSLSNEKRKRTMLEKYGVEYNSQRKEIHNIWKRPKLNAYALQCLSNKDWLYEKYVTQKKTGVEIAKELNCYYGTVLSFCNNYGFPIRHYTNTSIEEQELYDFVKSIYKGNIEKWNRDVLGNKEIDIFLPDLNLGFEFDGDYWHRNTEERDRIKDELAKEKSIVLSHVKECFWINYPELTKQLIEESIKTKSPISYYFTNVKSLFDFERFIANDATLELDNKPLKNYCLKYSIPYRKYCRFSKEAYENVICEFLKQNDLEYKTDNEKILVENKTALFVNLVDDFENSEHYYNRTKLYNNQGIRCIQLFEDHLLNLVKFKILKNIILHSLGKTKNKIYARTTTVKIFDEPSELKQFFNENNIQGYRNSNIAFALIDKNNRVVMAYCLGKPFFGKGKYDCEIIRGACLLNHSVVGGASKLWKAITDYFKNHTFKNKIVKNIVYYVDTNYYNGLSLSFLKNSKLIKEQSGFWNYFCIDDVMKNRDALHHSEIKNYYEKTKAARLKETNINILRCNNYVFKINNVGTKTFVIDL